MSIATPATGGASLLAIHGEPNSYDELRELYDLTADDLALFKKQIYDPVRHHKFPIDMAWIRMGCKLPLHLNNRLNYQDVMHIFKTCKRLALMKEAALTTTQRYDLRRERRLLAAEKGEGESNKDGYQPNKELFVRHETTVEREVMLLEAMRIATTAINNGKRSLTIRRDEQPEPTQTLTPPPSPPRQFIMNPQKPNVHRGRRPDIPLKTLCKWSRHVDWTPYAGKRIAFKRFEMGTNKLPSSRRIFFERKVMRRLAQKAKAAKKAIMTTGLHKPFKLPISRPEIPMTPTTPTPRPQSKKKLVGSTNKNNTSIQKCDPKIHPAAANKGDIMQQQQPAKNSIAGKLQPTKAGNEEGQGQPIAAHTRGAREDQVVQQVRTKDIVQQPQKTSSVAQKDTPRATVQQLIPINTVQKDQPEDNPQKKNKPENSLQENEPKDIHEKDKPKGTFGQVTPINNGKKGNIPDKYADKLAVLRDHANTIFAQRLPYRKPPRTDNPTSDDEEGGGVKLGDIVVAYKVTFNLSPTVLEAVTTPPTIASQGSDDDHGNDISKDAASEGNGYPGVVEVPMEKIFPEDGPIYQLDMRELVKVATALNKARHAGKNGLTTDAQVTPPARDKTPEGAMNPAPSIPTITLTPPREGRKPGYHSRRISEARKKHSRNRSGSVGRRLDDAVILPPPEQMDEIDEKFSPIINAETGECNWVMIYSASARSRTF